MAQERLSSVETVPAAAKGGKRVAPAEKKPASGGKKGWLIVTIVLAVLAAAYVGGCWLVQEEYGHRALPGTSVLGLDVSGLTAEEAETLWRKEGAEKLSTAVVELRDGETSPGGVTLAELGVTVTPEAVSRAAGSDTPQQSGGSGVAAFLRGGGTYLLRYIRPVDVVPELTVDTEALTAACISLADTLDCTLVDGTYRLEPGEGLYITKPRDGQRMDAAALERELAARLAAGDLSPVPCTYRQETAETLDVAALHQELAGEMVNARYDRATGQPTQSRVGVSFDVAAVQAQWDAAAPGTEFLAEAEVTFPRADTATLEEAMFRDVLGTSTTKCAGPWGRRQNIKLASKAINGNVYNPGEEFWYNAEVGQRTEARGFQPAAAYSGGKTVTSIGGGICQVSSTLYYAALLGDLEIVLRYAHMFDPGYMPVTGCDATVSWGGPDFAFRNSTDYPIKLVTSYNDDTNELTITILGTKTDDNYVVMTNQFLSYEDFRIIYREDESVASGEQVVEQYGHNGYAVRTYRNVYSGDGTLLRSTTEAVSDYDRGDKIILVAPGEVPQ